MRQAEWLSQWLTSAVGDPVPVRPALALPGWYVEQTAPKGPVVFSGKNPVFLADPRGAATLPEALIQRIAHQLEQRCRDVVPAAHREGR